MVSKPSKSRVFVKLNLSKYMRENFALSANRSITKALYKVMGGDVCPTETEYRRQVNEWAVNKARQILLDNGWKPTFEDPDRYTHPFFCINIPRGNRFRTPAYRGYSITTAIRACGKNEIVVEL